LPARGAFSVGLPIPAGNAQQAVSFLCREDLCLKVGQVQTTPRLLEERKKLGAFYTPERLSRILSEWAIKSPQDTVLEPSFGGCGFLQLGCRNPRTQIYGCDIDTVAFQYLANVLGTPVDLERFILCDFLDVENVQGWPDSFTAVLANPPYIPYQRIPAKRRLELTARVGPVEGLGGRASLWAYFVGHALNFLAPNGRMAWVLPGAFLQADYSAPIRAYLSNSFARCAAFVVRERLFLAEGTDEETIILLADGHLRTPSKDGIEVGEAQTLAELEAIIKNWDQDAWNGHTSVARPAYLSFQEAARAVFDEIASNKSCRALAECASVQIGIVTGANDFFVLSKEGLAVADLKISDCSRILAKFHAANGISFSISDHATFMNQGGKGYLVDSAGRLPNERIERYLNTFDLERRKKITTFKKRRVWSEPGDKKYPDAFFPVMHHDGPRLVLNKAGCNSTNTIHRVYFKQSLSRTEHMLAAISILTTFSQVSAELVGRRYGAGVLKHEPREAERIKLLLPLAEQSEIKAVFAEIDKLLRSGDLPRAMARADSFIFKAAGIRNRSAKIKALKHSLAEMRNRRRPQVAPGGAD
jgi:hypothetical protein